MKKLLVLCSLLLAIRAQAQVSIGTDGISLTAGTILSSEGLTLIPQGSLTLSNTIFQKSTTPINLSASVVSIPNVVTLSSPLAFSGTIRFYYQEADLNGSPESQLTLAYQSSGTWQLSTTATINTTDNYIEDLLPSISLNAVTATLSSSPLPVTLLSFAAKRQGNASVLLQWKTANELQNSHFVIERSGDGSLYQSIGSVKATDNATGAASYSFPDNDPLAGTNYYRLKQVDLDGHEQIYGVRIVQPGSAIASLYPNPVINHFKLELPATPDKPLNFTIQNASGQVVQTGIIHSREQWLETNRLLTGVYVIHLENGQAVRFFKQ
jgi:hypothetical protein